LGFYELITLCPGVPILAVNYLLWGDPKTINRVFYKEHQEE